MFCLSSCYGNFFVDGYLCSGFQTSVAPQQKIYVPPDVIDVIVTLKRSNLVRSYGIISTVAICELIAPPIHVSPIMPSSRDDNHYLAPRDDYDSLLWI